MENYSDELGKKLLEKIGFNVTKIQETSSKKQPDFICSYKNINVLIECKLKTDDKEVVRTKNAQLSSKGVFILDGKEGYSLNYKKIISTASKQIKSCSLNREFNFLLFISTGIHSMLKTQKIKSTLYGSTNLIIKRESDHIVLPCYNYTFSEFENYNNIDACIIMTESIYNKDNFYYELCLNHFSERFNILNSSNILEIFEEINNPLKEEAEGLAFIADKNINRKLNEYHKISPSHNPIIYHLKEKYNMGNRDLVIPVNFNRPEITVTNI